MSTVTQTELLRIQSARNTMRNKLVEMGLAESTAKIDVLATAVDDIANNGAVSAEVKEGETYTIPKGYHNGSGTVSGVAGGGNYALQSKSVTPTKKQQNITPDAGSYGLSDVTVEPIPEAYQDVTSVTAGSADVLANKTIVDATGKIVAGTMPNNGAVTKKIDTVTKEYTIPKGYHNGSGKVSVETEEKAVTPTEAAQDVAPSEGKVLSKVTVNPIPENYAATDDATVTADKILAGEVAFGKDAEGKAIKIEGTMPNNAATEQVLSPYTDMSYTIPEGYHDGNGKVKIQIKEPAAVTPTKSQQMITTDDGYVMSRVTVEPIPDAYQDVTSVNATAPEVLAGKKIVSATGAVVTGTMPNVGKVDEILDIENQTYTIPKGYHDGTGKVGINEETRSATPTKSEQTITPSSGFVLSEVKVKAIPDAYQDVTSVDATAPEVLAGKKIVSATGAVVTGTMANNGALNLEFDALSQTSVEIPAGYTSGGAITLTSDLEEALAAI